MMNVVVKPRMTPEQFVYWLQGYAEMNGSTPSQDQWQMIKDHLRLCFSPGVVSSIGQGLGAVAAATPEQVYNDLRKQAQKQADQGHQLKDPHYGAMTC